MSKGKQIALVVYDESAILKLVSAENEVDCDTAANGREASKLASEKLFDVVVADLRMPKLLSTCTT